MVASLRIACALLGEDKRCLEGGMREGWEGGGRKVEKSGEGGREGERNTEERREMGERGKNRRREGRKERGNGITIRLGG